MELALPLATKSLGNCSAIGKPLHIQMSIFFTRCTWKKGKNCYLGLEKNILRAVRRPFRHCISLWKVGDIIFSMVLSFFELTSITLWLTTKHKRFPKLMPNVHLEGLGQTLWNLILMKVCSMSHWWLTSTSNFIWMSSTYTSMVSSIKLANNLLAILW